MCVVSMIFDKYGPTWPLVPKEDPWKKVIEDALTPRRLSIEEHKTAIQLFQEIVKLTKKLDEMLGLPDCEDPAKMEWLEKIKAQIIEAEKKKVEEQLEFKF